MWRSRSGSPGPARDLANLVGGVLLGIGALFLANPGRAAHAFGVRPDARETFALHYATGVRTASLGLTVLALARSRHAAALGIVSGIAVSNAVGDAAIALVESGGRTAVAARHLPGVVLTTALAATLLRRSGKENDDA